MLFNYDRWHEVLQTLRRNRLRTVLTACGVFWGVFMLVLMLGFGKGLERGAKSGFGHWAPNVVFVWGDLTGKPWAGRQPGRQVQLTMADAEAVAANVPGVELVLPRNQFGGRGGGPLVVRRGDKAVAFPVFGDMAEYTRLESMLIDRGRFINRPDVDEHRKVAVIGTRVVSQLFEPNEDPIGARIEIGNVELLVVGIHRSPTGGQRADFLNGRIFMPRTTFARTFGTAHRINNLAVLVSADRPSGEVETEIRDVLKRRHAVAPDDARGIGSFNRQKEFGKVQGLFIGIEVLTWVVGVLTLFAGAIGVSNIMMIAVAERTREIGIRKAIGATPWSIVAQVVQEATLLTALAGYAGLVVGVGVVELAGRIVSSMPAGRGPQMFAAPEIELGKVIAAALVLTVAGAFAGLAPARSAVAIRPVEALAHE